MKKYVIPKGFHISHVLPSFWRKLSVLDFDFVFTSNCIYDLNDQHNQDVNKLYGVSFGLIHNTTTLWGRLFKSRANSFRIGWNCALQNRKIQLYAYYYNNGVRHIEYIGDADLNKSYNTKIYFDRVNNCIVVDINSMKMSTRDAASSTVDNAHGSYKFDFNKSPKWGILLKPFFGGTIAATHKMTIFIDKLK